MNFGGACDEATASAIVATACSQGLFAFDCANAYGNGLAETRLGAALAREDKDNRAFILTKIGRATSAGKPEGLSNAVAIDAARRSRDRLQRPIDLLLWHGRDPETPIVESLAAMAALIEEGTIAAFGVSNHSAWECMQVIHSAAQAGLPGPIHNQILYNVLVRDAERELFPFAMAHPGFSLSAYNPLAGGVLAREPGVTPKKSRVVRVPLYRHRYGSEALAPRIAELAELAASYKLSLRELAYGFVGSAPVTTILGPKGPEHLDGACATAALPEELRVAIDHLARRWRGTEATATG